VREVYKETSEAIGVDIAKVCFGKLVRLQNDPTIAEPAAVTVGLGEFAAWKEIKGDPAVVTGLSLGMFTAMGAAKFFKTYGDTVRAVEERAILMHGETGRKKGKMAGIVGMTLSDLEPMVHRCGAELAILRDKLRHSFVVTGGEEEVDEVGKEAKKSGVRKWEVLGIPRAFHSKLNQDITGPFDEILREFDTQDPVLRLLGNNALYLSTEEDVIEQAVLQLTETADWDGTIVVLGDAQIRNVAEFGVDESRGLARQFSKRYGAKDLSLPKAA
jgi:[acyl-carrier-protein] S-malonyltransferase